MHDFGDILTVIAAISAVGLYVWMLVWVYNNAENRGKSGCLAAIIVALLSFPVGLLAWIIFRPDSNSRRS